jgi:hypothetical protein
MSEVLSPNRERIRTSIRANQVVIDILEQVLDGARQGEIIAAAIALVRPDATICSCISGPCAGEHHLVAACDYLKQDIIAKTDN